MSRKRSPSRKAFGWCFAAEQLEGRQLLSVEFSQIVTTVSDQVGSAGIGLTNSSDGPSPTPAAQAVLSESGGTAVPGVDYTPVTETISFAASETSKTIQIPVLPAPSSDGTRMVQLELSPAQGGPPIAAAYLVIAHGSDTTPPKVIATKMLTKGPYVTGFVITFSKPMAPGPVQDVNNYGIDDPRSTRPIKRSDWALPTRQIALKSAVYDPATHSVTLRVAGKVRKSPVFTILDRGTNDLINEVGQFVSQKTQPNPSQLLPLISPITDTTGNPLASGFSDNADGHLYAVVSEGRIGRKLASVLNPKTSSVGTPPP
jgi:hypothetical protein